MGTDGKQVQERALAALVRLGEDLVAAARIDAHAPISDPATRLMDDGLCRDVADQASLMDTRLWTDPSTRVRQR